MSEPQHWHSKSCLRLDSTCPAVNCLASTTVPVLDATVICELARGHDGPHHGHIDAGPTSGSQHLMGPRSYDWTDESDA